MIILDTNVVSALMREHPHIAVVTWLDLQPPMSVWTTAITILECQFGIARMDVGQRRATPSISQMPDWIL